MNGSSSGTLGISTKGARLPLVPSTKIKLQDSSLDGSQGTSAIRKRKFGSLFIVSGDLKEGELDPVANKKISHLTDCFLHTSECVSMDMTAKMDKLDLNERYSQALKACHDVSVSFFLLFCVILFLLQAAFYLSLLPQAQPSRLQRYLKKVRRELKHS